MSTMGDGWGSARSWFRRNLVTALTAALACSTVACGAIHKEPAVGDPHAVAKVRLKYEQLLGERLDEHVHVNGNHVEIEDFEYCTTMTEGMPNRVREEPFEAEVRIAPGATSWSFSSSFQHTGQTTSGETCSQWQDTTTCNTNTQDTTEYDGSCEASLSHQAQDGATYYIEYTFTGDGACTATCRVKDSQSGTLSPCADAHVATSSAASGDASARYANDDEVEILWRGDWWPGRIVKVEGEDRYLISYEDYDQSWNEVVGPARLRSKWATCSPAVPG